MGRFVRRAKPHSNNASRRRKKSAGSQASAFQQIKDIADEQTRNLVRGIISGSLDSVAPEAMNGLRRRSHGRDLAKATQILIGERGAFPFPNIRGTYRNLLRPHGLCTIPAEQEAIFLSAHVASWPNLTVRIVGAMKAFAELPASEAQDAIKALTVFAEEFGASNYLAKKVAFIMARDGSEPGMQEEAKRIAEIVEQSKFPAPYFTSVEVQDSQFPYFPAISTRIQITQKYIKDDYRQILSLSDLVPVPLGLLDAAAYMRKAHSMSFVDEVVCLCVMLNGRGRWPTIEAAIRSVLPEGLLQEIESVGATPFNATLLYSDSTPEFADLTYYRRASAFVEFQEPWQFRGFVDHVLAPRLLGNAISVDGGANAQNCPTVRDLTKALHGFSKPSDYLDVQKSGSFLRTVNFLIYANNKSGSLDLDQHQIRFLFEHTMALDVLLSHKELERLYLYADESSKPLITVLALALHKAKNHSDDVDFKFRYSLSQEIIRDFKGSIVRFIEWLLNSTPQIANFLVYTLDRVTLQKLYWIISTADEADLARQEILRAVGKVRNSIEYFVEADSIEAQRQVAKLRRYFDDSRIYVDGIAMKKWLVENPSSYGQQYMRMIETNVPTVSAKAKVLENGKSIERGIDIPTATAFDYVLLQVAQTAFEQFCTNRDFGVESYLGRRIRHNTMTGMMRGGAEDLIEQPQFRVLHYEEDFMAANDRWIEKYRSFIDRIRRDYLQFRSDSTPKGLFDSMLRNDENTKVNIATLRNAVLSSRNAELFNELLIRFCWQEIDPQLVKATKYITVDLLNQAVQDLEEHLGGFSGELYGQYRTAVHNALHERFTRLGSWFRQPQDGFVSASTRKLGELIILEATDGGSAGTASIAWTGSATDLVVEGLSVHRMYDCLFVLIRNAIRYGDPQTPVEIEVHNLFQAHDVARLHVTVRSTFSPESDPQYHASRLAESFSHEDLGAAMVLEGYSGIRKLRYITKISEGQATAAYSVDGRRCAVSFSLTVEVAPSEVAAA